MEPERMNNEEEVGQPAEEDASNDVMATDVAEIEPAGPWTKAEWEADGLFKITTSLMGEKEIDVHDRGATVRFKLEMATLPEKDLTLNNVEVNLNFPVGEQDEIPAFYQDKDLDTYKNIALGVMPDNGADPADFPTKGQLTIISRNDKKNLFEGGRLEKLLRVKTGVFSSEDFNGEGAAMDGLKEYEIEITYEAQELRVQEESSVTTELLFYVAED